MMQDQITEWLQAWRGGDDQALERVTPLVYPELKRMARRYMSRERSGHTLEITEVVHEAYMRLTNTRQVDWHDRNHFLAVCARLMRRVLVDHARARGYRKRGGGQTLLPLEEAAHIRHNEDIELLALDQALTHLAAFDPRKYQVVELRFFGGLTVAETAEVLNVSTDTVLRDWKMAKACLLHEMDSPSATTCGA